MLHLYLTLYTLGVDLQARAEKLRDAVRDERGSVTLEQVIVTAGLAALAIAAIAAIALAVKSRLAGI